MYDTDCPECERSDTSTIEDLDAINGDESQLMGREYQCNDCDTIFEIIFPAFGYRKQTIKKAA